MVFLRNVAGFRMAMLGNASCMRVVLQVTWGISTGQLQMTSSGWIPVQSQSCLWKMDDSGPFLDVLPIKMVVIHAG